MICLNCGKELTGFQTKYCCKKCNIKTFYKKHRSEEVKKAVIRNRDRGSGRKKILIEQFGGKCQICGYHKNSAALSFHHKNPEQMTFRLTISRIKGLSWNKILEESKKCLLVCENCHKEIHYPHLAVPPSIVNLYDIILPVLDSSTKKRLKKRIKLLSLANSSCHCCGYSSNLAALVFHHKNPSEKKYSLSGRDIIAVNWDDCVKETQKCVLLCCNCH